MNVCAGSDNSTVRKPPRRLLRLVRLVHLLLVDPDSARSRVLQSELKATRRTILRDLDLLRRAGLAVQFNYAEGHYQFAEALKFPLPSELIDSVDRSNERETDSHRSIPEYRSEPKRREAPAEGNAA